MVYESSSMLCCFCDAPYQALSWSKFSLMNFKIFERKFPEIHKEKWNWHVSFSYWIHSHSNKCKLCTLNLHTELEVYCQKNIEFAFLYNIRNSHTGQSLPLIVTPSPFKAIFHSLRNFFAYRFETHLIKKNLFYHSVSGSILINNLE